MKTKFTTIIGLVIGSFVLGQVGINNNDPKATLDVIAKTTDGSRAEGIIAPRLTGDEIKAANSQYGTDQMGTLVYAKSAITSADSTGKTSRITAAGYYYFDGSTWQKVGGANVSAGDATDDAWINDPLNKMVKLGSKSDSSTARDAGTDFVAEDNGNVGIGNASPNAYARLDVKSTNQGILIPRVNLSSTTMDLNTDGDNDISNQPAGLLAYNTGTDGLKYKGYVYWSGTEWRSLNNTTTGNPSITTLNCGDAVLSPSQLIANTAYSGYMSVPYKGGNGASYPSGNPIPSSGNTGLTATLQSGQLATGDGYLTYLITGTPAFNSPILAQFNLGNTVLGAPGCTASVGTMAASGNEIKKLIYAGTAPDPNQTLTIGGMVFRYNNAGGRWGPQMALSSSVAKRIYVGMNQQYAKDGFEYANWTKTYTVANAKTYQNIATDTSNEIVNTEYNVFHIVDVDGNAYYRVTFYISGPSTGSKAFVIIAEQF